MREYAMSLKKYEAFVKTVELGSLTNAAHALGSTQSRISHILNDLEAEYGFTLLYRNRSGIQLTEAGNMLLPKMQEILRQKQELDTLVREIQSSDAGTIRLGAFTSVAVHWLPGIIRTFQTAHPNVEIKMYNGDYHDVDQWLQNGDIDLGFVTLPICEDMRTIPLTEDPLVAILPRGHRLAALDQIPLKELEKETFITLLENSDHDIHRALDQAQIYPKVKFTTKDDYAILAMVEQGLGVSIVPSLLLKGSKRDLEIRPLTPVTSRTIALAIAEENPLPVVHAFSQTAVTWIQNNQ